MGRRGADGEGRRRDARLAAQHAPRPVPRRGRSWRRSSPNPRVQILFRSASALHQNFYEGDMREPAVSTGLDDAQEITDLLACGPRLIGGGRAPPYVTT